VLAQLLPDDRRIEWGGSLKETEDLLIGTISASELETNVDRLAQARAVFEEMQRQYSAGNFARYGELLQQLGKLLAHP